MATSNYILSGQGLASSQNMQACTRCSGLLIREGLFDLFEDTGHMRRWAWRCVQCGDIVDSLILKHRKGVNLPAPATMRRRHWPALQVLTRRPARW